MLIEYLDSPMKMSLPIKPASPEEISKILRDLKSKKTPGYDLITAKVLNEMPKKALIYLTTIFNSIMRTGHLPNQWKVSQIIMIHKPNKRDNELSSYPPISLLPILSKVFEKMFVSNKTNTY